MIEAITYEKTLKRGVLHKNIPNQKNTKFWINITEPTKEEINQIKEIFKLHSTTIDDLMIQTARPKVEQFEKYTLIIFFVLNTENNAIKSTPLAFIIGKNYIITCSQSKIDLIEDLRNQKGRLSEALKHGNDYLLHSIMESMINNYFPQLEIIDNELDRLENLALTNPNPKVLERMLSIKRELQKLRKIIYPQREIISNLSAGRYAYTTEETKAYFRDLYDHMIIITDLIEDYRETITSIMEVNLSVTSNKLNEVMKVLTIIATVLMPPTLIASIYGMNFEFMPELAWRYGYFIILGVMLLVIIVTVIFLKRKKWI